MHLLVIAAQEDLSKALSGLSLDDSLLFAFAPEGFEIEFAENLDYAIDLVKESAQFLKPVDIIIADEPLALEAAQKLHELSAELKIAVVVSPESEELLKYSPAILTLKRPFLPGELERFIQTLVELSGGHREFDGLFNSSSSLLALVSSSGVVSAWNAAAVSMTGVQQKDAAGSSIWTLLPFLAGHEESLARALENASQVRLNSLLVETEDADEKFFDVTFSPMPSARGAVVKVDDITTEVKKDEHLRQAQKMDSVGSLAAGLAHDFNNVIGGIEATMSTLRYSIDADANAEALRGSLSNDFELIDDSIKRGKDIISQLMSLSRRKEQPFAQANLNKILADVIAICRNTFSEDVKLDTVLWPGAAMVMAFPTQIEQAFLNLCINASHAMTIMRKDGEPRGGTLSVSITQVEVGENIVSVMPEASVGKYWLITVSDTGVGMTREIIQRIFEPFFTTKPKGKGTGLGLAMVYNIIRQHKGFLDIYSEPGAGSSFLVFLPVFDSAKAMPE